MSETSFNGPNYGTQMRDNNGTIYLNVDPTDHCLRDLLSTDSRDDKERIREAKGYLSEGSYKWVLDHPTFHQWQDESQIRSVWLKGDPGKGKTMLLIGIIDELEAKVAEANKAAPFGEPSTLICYFFFETSFSDRSNPTFMLRALIFLLACQRPSMLSRLRERYKLSGSKLFDGVNAYVVLKKAFLEMLGNEGLKSIYIVIDALDECEHQDREQLFNLVDKISSHSQVKLLMSSRNDSTIKLQPKSSRLLLLVEDNTDAISTAIGTYVNEKLMDIESLRSNTNLREKIRDIIHSRAGGMFLCAYLAVKELEETGDVMELAQTSSNLGELYGRMMRRLKAQNDTKICLEVLTIVLTVSFPLHALELGALSRLPDRIVGDLEAIRKLVSRCGSYLTVRDNRIYFIHDTARQYLQEALLGSDSHQVEAHHLVFQRSLECMNQKLKRNLYGVNEDEFGVSIDEIIVPDPDPLLPVRYSCMHWVDHLWKAQNPDDLGDGGIVDQFFRKSFMYWLEALGLLGHANKPLYSVVRIEQLLVKHTKTMDNDGTPASMSNLRSLMADIRRFLVYFGWIISKTPLQIYVSPYIFTPLTSQVRSLFRNGDGQAIATCLTPATSWSSLLNTLDDTSDVSKIVFSHDSTLIATGGHQQASSIKVFDVATGEGIRVFSGFDHAPAKISSLTFSPDDALIASGHTDGTVYVWDVANDKTVAKRSFGGAGMGSVAFSPSGDALAIASDHSTVLIWDFASDHLNCTLEGPMWPGTSIAFSPDAMLLAAGSSDGTVTIWDISTGKPRRTTQKDGGLAAHFTLPFRAQTEVYHVAFSPNGTEIISTAASNRVAIWDAATATLKREFYATENITPSTLASKAFSAWTSDLSSYQCGLSPDGKLAAFRTSAALSDSSATSIAVWETSSGSHISTLPILETAPNAFAFSPDGIFLAAGSPVDIWDIRNIDTAQHSADNKRSQARGMIEDHHLTKIIQSVEYISFWDNLHPARLLEVLITESWNPESPWPGAVSFRPDGMLRVFYDMDHIQLVDLEAATVRRMLDTDEIVRCLQYREKAIPAHDYGIADGCSWITYKRQKLIWLAPDYRPKHPCPTWKETKVKLVIFRFPAVIEGFHDDRGLRGQN